MGGRSSGGGGGGAGAGKAAARLATPRLADYVASRLAAPVSGAEPSFAATRGATMLPLSKLAAVEHSNLDPGRFDGAVAAMQRVGAQRMDPIRVFVDSNGRARIGDGNHRLMAARALGLKEIRAVVSVDKGRQSWAALRAKKSPTESDRTTLRLMEGARTRAAQADRDQWARLAKEKLGS